MSITPAQGLSSLPAQLSLTTSEGRTEDQKIKESAKQFEAILINELLKSAQPEDGGLFGAGEDETSSATLDMATSQLSQAMANSGGLGISKLVMEGLQRKASAQP